MFWLSKEIQVQLQFQHVDQLVPPLHHRECEWSHSGHFPAEYMQTLMLAEHLLEGKCLPFLTDNPLQSLKSTAAPYAGRFPAKSFQKTPTALTHSLSGIIHKTSSS